MTEHSDKSKLRSDEVGRRADNLLDNIQETLRGVQSLDKNYQCAYDLVVESRKSDPESNALNEICLSA